MTRTNCTSYQTCVGTRNRKDSRRRHATALECADECGQSSLAKLRSSGGELLIHLVNVSVRRGVTGLRKRLHGQVWHRVAHLRVDGGVEGVEALGGLRGQLGEIKAVAGLG